MTRRQRGGSGVVLCSNFSLLAHPENGPFSFLRAIALCHGRWRGRRKGPPPGEDAHKLLQFYARAFIFDSCSGAHSSQQAE